MTPAETHGVLNDALSIYFADATRASAFVTPWCVRAKIETAGGVFQVREDDPEPRSEAGLHRTQRVRGRRDALMHPNPKGPRRGDRAGVQEEAICMGG
jgi:hypothetical protein